MAWPVVLYRNIAWWIINITAEVSCVFRIYVDSVDTESV